MTRIIALLLVVMVLGAPGVFAEPRPVFSEAAVSKIIARETALSRTIVRQRNSRDARRGALIGLVVGTAAAAAYWSLSNCKHGSDSQSVIVTHCVAPSAGMIAGGWFIGRELGRDRDP